MIHALQCEGCGEPVGLLWPVEVGPVMLELCFNCAGYSSEEQGIRQSPDIFRTADGGLSRGEERERVELFLKGELEPYELIRLADLQHRHEQAGFSSDS